MSSIATFHGFSRLPSEVKQHILSFLSNNDLNRAAQVSREMNAFAQCLSLLRREKQYPRGLYALAIREVGWEALSKIPIRETICEVYWETMTKIPNREMRATHTFPICKGADSERECLIMYWHNGRVDDTGKATVTHEKKRNVLVLLYSKHVSALCNHQRNDDAGMHTFITGADFRNFQKLDARSYKLFSHLIKGERFFRNGKEFVELCRCKIEEKQSSASNILKRIMKK